MVISAAAMVRLASRKCTRLMRECLRRVRSARALRDRRELVVGDLHQRRAIVCTVATVVLEKRDGVWIAIRMTNEWITSARVDARTRRRQRTGRTSARLHGTRRQA